MSARRLVLAVAVVAGIGGGVALTPTKALAAPTDLYVATAGSDSNACTTSVEPCHTIAHAIALAGVSGTTIHVAAGQYGSVTPGSKNVTVVGVGTDYATGTVISSIGAAVVVNDPAGVLTLKSLVAGGDPIGAYVTAGTLNVV